MKKERRIMAKPITTYRKPTPGTEPNRVSARRSAERMKSFLEATEHMGYAPETVKESLPGSSNEPEKKEE